MQNEYKVLCKVKIDNLEKAFDKGTNFALNAYFDGLMQQMEDNDQPSMAITDRHHPSGTRTRA